jgi:dolichyl-phosphate-mannose-protein mannosyltransferase
LLPTLSYRWLNALIGACIPLLVAGIAYQLSQRRSYALIASAFTALDGFLLVESRYALLSIHILFWGLLAHLCFLSGLNPLPRSPFKVQGNLLRKSPLHPQNLWLLLAGICLGGAAAVKWYGLGFWLGLTLLWPFTGLRRWQWLTYLGVVPLAVYGLLWIPHLQQNPTVGLIQLHQQILDFHLTLPAGTAVHPYCSRWWSWPLMQRPMAYLYQDFSASTPPVIYDVHGIGNPLLWWLAAGAMIGLIGPLGWWVKNRYWCKVTRSPQLIDSTGQARFSSKTLWVSGYLLVNYGANWLPWSQVNRCTFIYYYLNAFLFACLALAWLVDQGLHHNQAWRKSLSISVMVLIGMAFLFWLPLYLGLPLSPTAFHHRLWFHTWY